MIDMIDWLVDLEKMFLFLSFMLSCEYVFYLKGFFFDNIIPLFVFAYLTLNSKIIVNFTNFT